MPMVIVRAKSLEVGFGRLICGYQMPPGQGFVCFVRVVSRSGLTASLDGGRQSDALLC